MTTHAERLKKVGKEREYYNFSKLLSYNAVYNCAVGGRGIGKTFGAKKLAIDDFIKRGNQFMYVRRYKDELKTSKATFFADIEHLYPDWDFRVTSKTAEASPVSAREDKNREWSTMGFFIALSVTQAQKSVAFPRVKTIIFDEFIIEKGATHYLPQEATILNNLYNTVDRYRDFARVIMLANAVTLMNPYFIAWGIVPSKDSEFVSVKAGFIRCHFPESSNFNSSVMQTRFGKFIEGTEYADYAVGNNFSDNHEELLGTKDSRMKYRFTLETEIGTFSVWMHASEGEYFIQARAPKDPTIYTMVHSMMSAEKILVTFQDKELAYLRAAFNRGSVTFDHVQTRNSFIQIFKR